MPLDAHLGHTLPLAPKPQSPRNIEHSNKHGNDIHCPERRSHPCSRRSFTPRPPPLLRTTHSHCYGTFIVIRIPFLLRRSDQLVLRCFRVSQVSWYFVVWLVCSVDRIYRILYSEYRVQLWFSSFFSGMYVLQITRFVNSICNNGSRREWNATTQACIYMMWNVSFFWTVILFLVCTYSKLRVDYVEMTLPSSDSSSSSD